MHMHCPRISWFILQDMTLTPYLSLLTLPSGPGANKPMCEQISSNEPGDHGVGRPLFRGGVKRAEISWDNNTVTSELYNKSDLFVYLHLQGHTSLILENVHYQLSIGDLFYIPPKTNFELLSKSDQLTQSLSFHIKDDKEWQHLRHCLPFIKKKYQEAPIMYCLLRQILDARSDPEDHFRPF